MSFLNTWVGVAAMFALGIGLFVYSFWLGARRRKAVEWGHGIDIRRMGIGMVEGGLVIGGSCLLFREVPPSVPWRDVVAASLLGAVAGVLLMRRATAKWDVSLREGQALQPHIVAWWESRWTILGITLGLLLFSLLLPSAVASFASALGNLAATSGFLISGFFFASGLSIVVWAGRRSREYGKPITLPLDRV
jgi:hypothetical protein